MTGGTDQNQSGNSEGIRSFRGFQRARARTPEPENRKGPYGGEITLDYWRIHRTKACCGGLYSVCTEYLQMELAIRDFGVHYYTSAIQADPEY